MVDNLMGIPEFVKQLITQNAADFLLGIFSVKTIGADQKNILLFNACCIQLLKNQADRHLSVRGRLLAALYTVRENDGYLGAFMSQLGKRLHSHWVADGFQGLCLNLILRNIRRIRNGLSRDKNVCGIRKICCHQSMSVLK